MSQIKSLNLDQGLISAHPFLSQSQKSI